MFGIFLCNVKSPNKWHMRYHLFHRRKQNLKNIKSQNKWYYRL